MADQAMAETRSLDPPAAKQVPAAGTTVRVLAGACRAGRCWARYTLVGRRRGVQGLADFVAGNHFFGALQVREELLALAEIIAARQPERALEIGTYRGGTLFLLTRLASPNATIISVDLPGGRFGGGYSDQRAWFYKHFARRSQRLHLLRGDSHSAEMFGRVKTTLSGQPLDYLFIDGDHRYEGVKRDFEMYAPLVRRGGIIAMHDIVEHLPSSGCEASRLWDEIKPRYRHVEIVTNKCQGWAGIGVLYAD